MSSMRIVPILMFAMLAVACGGEQAPAPEPSPAPPAPPAGPPPVAAAETAAFAEAVRGIAPDLECADFATAVGQALAGHKDAIERHLAGAAADPTALSEADEAVLRSLAEQARSCSGQVDLAALGVTYVPEMAAQDSCDCNSWCPSGGAAWWQTTVAAAACLGGSNVGCCEAASWPSHSACINTYCPDNICCSEVGPGMEDEEEGEEE